MSRIRSGVPEVRRSRVRPVQASNPPLIPTSRRSRPAPAKSLDTKPCFTLDWSRSLQHKFQIYMVASYLYYQLDFSLLLDQDYDRLCHELADNWRRFNHQHKKYASLADMQAGTGYSLKYPMIVQGAAESIRREFSERRSA